jgi:hypothetical protein
MRDILEPTISGFNQFITEQAQQAGECKVSVRLFDNQHDVLYDNVDIKDVPLLDTQTFVPRAMTALYDAVGMAVIDLGNELAALTEEDRPGKVIVLVITDGEENSSVTWSAAELKTLVEQQQNVYNWTFLFIGGGIDAKAGADSLAFKKSLSFSKDPLVTRKMFSKISSDVEAVRGMSADAYALYNQESTAEDLS